MMYKQFLPKGICTPPVTEVKPVKSKGICANSFGFQRNLFRSEGILQCLFPKAVWKNSFRFIHHLGSLHMNVTPFIVAPAFPRHLRPSSKAPPFPSKNPKDQKLSKISRLGISLSSGAEVDGAWIASLWDCVYSFRFPLFFYPALL